MNRLEVLNKALNNNEIKKLTPIQLNAFKNIWTAWANNEEAWMRLSGLHKKSFSRVSVEWLLKYNFIPKVETWTESIYPIQKKMIVLIWETKDKSQRFLWNDSNDIAHWGNYNE